MNSHTHYSQPRRDRHVTLGDIRPVSRSENHRSRTTPDFRFEPHAAPEAESFWSPMVVLMAVSVFAVSYIVASLLRHWIA